MGPRLLLNLLKSPGCALIVAKIFLLLLHNAAASRQTKASQQSNLFALPLADMMRAHKESATTNFKLINS